MLIRSYVSLNEITGRTNTFTQRNYLCGWGRESTTGYIFTHWWTIVLPWLLVSTLKELSNVWLTQFPKLWNNTRVDSNTSLPVAQLSNHRFVQSDCYTLDCSKYSYNIFHYYTCIQWKRHLWIQQYNKTLFIEVIKNSNHQLHSYLVNLCQVKNSFTLDLF